MVMIVVVNRGDGGDSGDGDVDFAKFPKKIIVD